MTTTSIVKRVLLALGVIAIVIVVYVAFLTYRLVGQIQDGTIDLSQYGTSQQTTLSQSGAAGAGVYPSSTSPDVINRFDDDPSIGPKNATLTIVAFEDFECPFSRQAFPAIRRMIAANPDVRFVYRDFPISDIHEHAQKAAEAGQCAHEQGAFWQYHDKLFTKQALETTALKQYARELNLDGAAFDTCLDSGKYEKEVQADFADGIAAGVRGTPTFFFNGNVLAGVITDEGFKKIIEFFHSRAQTQANAK